MQSHNALPGGVYASAHNQTINLGAPHYVAIEITVFESFHCGSLSAPADA